MERREAEKYLQGVPSYLTHTVRAIIAHFREITTERRLKKFSSNSRLHVIHQDVHKLCIGNLERLLEMPYVKDVMIWNMKNSDVHDVIRDSPSQNGSTPCESLRPIVVECVCYAGSDGEKEHGDPIRVERMFRDDFKKQLNTNASVTASMEEQLPLTFDGLITKTPVLSEVIRKVMSLIFIEFSESVPYVTQCDTVSYKAFSVSSEKLHCYTIINPPSLSARKILYINTTFTMHIKTIQFSTRLQTQTRNVESSVLSIVFTEPCGPKDRDNTKLGGYYKANTGVKITPKPYDR